MLKKLGHFLFYLLIGLFLFSCDDAGNTDNLALIDSDGDGYTDDQEINELNFNPDKPWVFNPHIADIPEISFEITSPPDIRFIATESATTTDTIQTQWGTTTTNTASTSKASGVTTGIVHSAGVSITAESDFSLTGGGTSVSATASYNYTNSREASTSYSTDQSNEKSRVLEELVSQENSTEVNYKMGILYVTVKIINPGHIAYTLNDIQFSAGLYHPLDEKPYDEIGNLKNYTIEAETYKDIPFEPHTFRTSGDSIKRTFGIPLTLSQAKEVLNNIGSIRIKLGSADMVRPDTNVSFAHDDTTIGAKTFGLTIDFGITSDRKPEIYRICDSKDARDLKQVLVNQLGIGTVIEGTRLSKTGLLQLRTRVSDDTTPGGWIIFHQQFPDGPEAVTKIYHPGESYTLDQIKPVRGENILITYVEDRDGDGLLAREEFFYGTSDDKKDTDGDGIDDYTEVVKNKTDPTVNPDNNYVPDPTVYYPSEVSDLTIEVTEPSSSTDYTPGDDVILRWKNTESNPDKMYDKIIILRGTGPIDKIKLSDTDGTNYTSNIDSIGPVYSSTTPAQKANIIAVINNKKFSFMDPTAKFNQHYYYKIITYNSNKNKYSKIGSVIDSTTNVRLRIKWTEFSIRYPSNDSGETDLRWTFYILNYENNKWNRYHTFCNYTDKDSPWQPNTDSSFDRIDESGNNTFEKLFSVEAYNLLIQQNPYIRTWVIESDTAEYDHEHNVDLIKEMTFLSSYLKNREDKEIEVSGEDKSNHKDQVTVKYFIDFLSATDH